MSSPVPLTNNLSQIYPEISEELFNKHAKLLSELKNRFTDLYDGFEPEKYVVVNGVAKLVDLGRGLQAGFALENGVTVIYGRTYPNEDLFINGNHLEEEIIFNPQGRHTEGIHQKVDEIRDLLLSIRRNAASQDFYGGILYVHSNIGEELFASQECFMLAVYLALLQIHQELPRYTRNELIAELTKADPSLSRAVLNNILGEFEVGHCKVAVSCGCEAESDNELELALYDPHSDKSIKTHESNESIRILGEQRSFKSTASKGLRHRPSASTKSNESIESLVETDPDILSSKLLLDPARKLVLCKLDLCGQELQLYNEKVARARELSQLSSEGRNDIFGEEGQDRELLHYCEEMQALLSSWVSKRVELEEFIAQKHGLDLKYELFDEAVVDLLAQIRLEAPFLKNFCLLEGTVLLIAADRAHYPEIIRFLRRLFNDYKLSTCRFLQTHRRLEEEKHCEIGEIMFTTSPSLGCAIYDPADNSWL